MNNHAPMTVNRLAGVFAVAVLALLPMAQAETRVLVLGGSQPYSNTYEGGAPIEAAFAPDGVASNLQGILDGDSAVSQPVTVQSEDTFRSNSVAPFCTARTLMSWFYWPDTLAETRSLLQDGWDHVVLIDDLLVAAAYPEYHLEGVRAVCEEVRKGGSRPIVVMQPSFVMPMVFMEKIYRVGDGVGIPVAPAGYAWDRVDPLLKDSGTWPTPRAVYVTAATLYSQIYNRSATNSAFIPAGMSPSDRDALAETAFVTVQTEATNTHYSGSYRGPTHFASPANKKRHIEVADFNSSTENGIANQWGAVLGGVGMSHYRHTSGYQSYPYAIGHVIDFCQSRKLKTANTNYWTHYASFDYMDNYGGKTMIYGLDRVIYRYPHPEQQTGAARVTSTYMDQGEFFVPVRLLWSRIRTAHPEIPWQPDGHHMSGQMLQGIATMMVTLLTGRCPVGDEPADRASEAWQNWFCRKTGYEIAWQLASMNARVPGFEVLPRATSATNVTTTTDETLTVRFLYAPTSTVTVAVSVDNTHAVLVNPKTLIFTPDNHATAQTVSIRALPGATTSEAVTVSFDSSSADSVFDELNDQWAYNAIRSTAQAVTVVHASPLSLSLAEDTPTAVDLGVLGAASDNTVVVGPLHGSFSTDSFVYTPLTNYFGADAFAYSVTVDATVTVSSVSLDITNTPDTVALTSPADGAVYADVDRITLAVDGYWEGGTVDYFADGDLVRSVSNAPWTAEWSSEGAGSHAFKAVARDIAGLVSTSAVANIVVSNSGAAVWWQPTSGSWGESTNWLADLVPVGADDVLFTELDIQGGVTVRLDATRAATRLIFGDRDKQPAQLAIGSDPLGLPVFDTNGPAPSAWVVSGGLDDLNVLAISGAEPTIEVRDLIDMPASTASGPGQDVVTIDAVIETTGGLTKTGPGTLVLARTNQIPGGVLVRSTQSGVMAGSRGALGVAPVTLEENTWLGCPDGDGVTVTITNDVLLTGAVDAHYRVGPGMAADLTLTGSIDGSSLPAGSALYLGGNGRGVHAFGGAAESRLYNALGTSTFTMYGDVTLGSRTLNIIGNWPSGDTRTRIMSGHVTAGDMIFNQDASSTTSELLIGGDAQVDLSGTFAYSGVRTYRSPVTIQDQARVHVAGDLRCHALTISDHAQVTAPNIFGYYWDGGASVDFQGGTTTVGAVRSNQITFDGGVLRAQSSTDNFVLNGPNVSTYTFKISEGGLILDSAGEDIGISLNITHGTGEPDGGLRKRGAGSLSLNGTNTYNGPTVVEGGSLLRTVGAAVPAGTAFTVSTGAIIDLGGTPLSVNTFAGGGVVTNGDLIVSGAMVVSHDAPMISDDLTVTSGAMQVQMSTAGPGVVVGGTVMLGGSLSVTLTAAATTNSSLVLIRAAAIVGTFNPVVLPPGWSLVYTPTEVRAVADPPNTPNTVPYRESFEGYQTDETLVGRNGWYATRTAALTLSEASHLIDPLLAYAGMLPIQTNHTRVAVLSETITNRFEGVGNGTWVDMMLRMQTREAAVAPADMTDTQCGFMLGTNGQVKAYAHSLSGGTNRWMEFSHAPVSNAVWSRLSVHLDYSATHPGYPGRGWFQCYLGGQLLTHAEALTRPDAGGVGGGSWLPMARANTPRLSRLEFLGESVLDDLVVDTAVPSGFSGTVSSNGTPHWWLASYGHADNFDAAALLDDDEDGMLNWEEYIAGTIASNDTSLLAVTGLAQPTTNQVVLQWPSVAGRIYSVDRTDALTNDFSPLAGDLPADPPMNIYTDVVTEVGTLFYRVGVRR